MFCWGQTPAEDRTCSEELAGGGRGRCPAGSQDAADIPTPDSSGMVLGAQPGAQLGAQLAARASHSGQLLHLLPGDQHLRLPARWEAQPLKWGSVMNFVRVYLELGAKI